MSKRQTFVIDITFSDSITTDEDIQEISDNLERAIIAEVNGGEGIAPLNSDSITESVEISQQGIILSSTKVY